MKKFVKNTIVFALIVCIITLAVNFVYVRQERSDSDNVEKFGNVPYEIELCNFGSSHGLYGYNYCDFDDEYRCFNFALSAQMLSYDKRIFEYYRDHISEGAVVFITVSYFSLFGQDEIYGDSFESKNKRYYKFLPAELIKEYDIKTGIYVNYFPSLVAGGRGLVSTLIGRSVNVNEDIWSKDATIIDVAADAGAAYERHILTNKVDDEGNRIRNEEEINALYYLIDECRKIGAIPILITTPYLKEYTDKVSDNDLDFYTDFYNEINTIVGDTNVSYYDFGRDERFESDYSLFLNSDHLNKEGARVFVGILMREVVPKEK